MSSPSKFVWHDQMSNDLKGAESFYAAVIGWNIESNSMGPERPYSLLKVGDVMVGGLMPIPEHAKGMPAVWMGYIGVDDVDSNAREVAAAGGSIMREPEDIPGVGRFAVVTDPHGAAFIIFKSNMDTEPADFGMMPGHIGWHELHAGNLDEAWAFYSKLFGWKKLEAHDMGAFGSYQTFALTGALAGGGMMTKAPHFPTAAWTYYINVADIDVTAERIKANGGTVIHGPVSVPGGIWTLNGIDPQGAHFGAVGMKNA